MLMDILGIAIGFVTVILLLSLAVTGIVQVFQHFLGLRGRNLEVAMERMVESLREQGIGTDADRSVSQTLRPACPAKAKSGKEKKRLGDCLKQLRDLVPRSPSSAIDIKDVYRLLDSETRELLAEPDSTDEEPSTQLIQKAKAKSTVEHEFEKMETQSGDLFIFRLRAITFAVALIVAGYYQASTPKLLHDLSTYPAYREGIVQSADEIVQKSEQIMANQGKYGDVAKDAIQELEEKYSTNSTYESVLAKVNGFGSSRSDILRELKEVLQRYPGDHSKVIQDYEDILDKRYRQLYGATIDDIRSIDKDLAAFGISGWSGGWEFYSGSGGFGNVIGVLFTAILMSFGAPFWFERLRELINLQNALGSRNKRKPKKSQKSKAQGNASAPEAR